MYAAKVLRDSISQRGHRLSTLQVTFPRFVLAEFNTHRVFSRNSASSRAIPIEKQIAKVLESPVIPSFASNKAGMQPGEEFSEQDGIRGIWLKARDEAVLRATELLELGVHKQWVNRLLEPFMWHTVIVTATEWDNYFGLRINPDAQIEIQTVSSLMKKALGESEPKLLGLGDWHLPLYGDEFGDEKDGDSEKAIKLSIARCARVSYLTHDGIRDEEADIRLYDRLRASGHMSPFEHVARPMEDFEIARGEFLGNFRGWVQRRKELVGEAVFGR